jgi:hypothetical protein
MVVMQGKHSLSLLSCISSNGKDESLPAATALHLILAHASALAQFALKPTTLQLTKKPVGLFVPLSLELKPDTFVVLSDLLQVLLPSVPPSASASSASSSSAAPATPTKPAVAVSVSVSSPSAASASAPSSASASMQPPTDLRRLQQDEEEQRVAESSSANGAVRWSVVCEALSVVQAHLTLVAQLHIHSSVLTGNSIVVFCYFLSLVCVVGIVKEVFKFAFDCVCCSLCWFDGCLGRSDSRVRHCAAPRRILAKGQ